MEIKNYTGMYFQYVGGVTAYTSRFALQSPHAYTHCLLYKSTPVECLHTILLGPYKYMYLIASLMDRLTSREKQEVKAKIAAFDFAGFDKQLSTSLCQHYQSFNGHDFKVLAQT